MVHKAILAVCFDFDGTLANFEGDFEAYSDELRAELRLEPSLLEPFAGLLSRNLRKEGAVTLHSALLATFEGLELPVPVDLEGVVSRAVERYGTGVKLLPGAREVLEFCAARIPLALITNGPEDMQRAGVRNVGIAHYFKTLVISGAADVGVRKPNPRVFRLACERLGVAPEHALMIGDHAEADIRGARAVGMTAVHLEREGPPTLGTREIRLNQGIKGGRVRGVGELEPLLPTLL